MINRDNLSIQIDFEAEYCAAISISENQYDIYQKTIKRLQLQNPKLRIKESKGWLFHNGGYYYKEVCLNSFQALEKIGLEISDIPVKKRRV